MLLLSTTLVYITVNAIKFIKSGIMLLINAIKIVRVAMHSHVCCVCFALPIDNNSSHTPTYSVSVTGQSEYMLYNSLHAIAIYTWSGSMVVFGGASLRPLERC